MTNKERYHRIELWADRIGVEVDEAISKQIELAETEIAERNYLICETIKNFAFTNPVDRIYLDNLIQNDGLVKSKNEEYLRWLKSQ